MSDFMDISRVVRAKMEALQDELNILGKQYFKEASKSIFDEFPGLEWFNWSQYTPYFNDGDECVFSVHAYGNAMLNGEEVEEIYFSSYGNKTPTTDEDRFAVAYQELLNNVPESVMKDLFGDHVQVTINRDGTVVVEDQEHD